MKTPGGSWISASALAAGVLLGTAATARAQDPAALAVTASVRNESLDLSISTSGFLAATPRVEGRELLLAFDGPVRVDLPQALLDTTAGWISGLQTGYDTLLVTAARDVDFEISRLPDRFDVRLSPRGAGDLREDALGQRRLELLRAQWYAAMRREAAALGTLTALDAESPGDPQVLTAIGLTERRIGWRRRADATLQRALAADRANPDLRRLLADMRAERRPEALFDVEGKDVANEWHTRSQRTAAARSSGDAVRYGGRLELLQFDARKVRRATGEIAPMQRALWRGDAWLRYDTLRGPSWAATLFGAPSGPGASLEASFPQPSGRWTLQAEAHRPFWEFVEGLAGDGTRDRLAVERQQRLGRHVNGWLVVSTNRYAIDGGAYARTAGISGGLIAPVREARPFVALSYGLDKESQLAATVRTDPSGASYMPVPVVSREVHLPAVQVRQDVGRGVAIDAYAGYAIDRLGGKGPVTEVHARWSRGRVAADVFVDRRLQALATTTTVTRVGANVSLRLGA